MLVYIVVVVDTAFPLENELFPYLFVLYSGCGTYLFLKEESWDSEALR
jgi:hypothetical protein